jgi:hypothetical protein
VTRCSAAGGHPAGGAAPRRPIPAGTDGPGSGWCKASTTVTWRPSSRATAATSSPTKPAPTTSRGACQRRRRPSRRASSAVRR